MRVCSARVLTRVPEASDEPGSLKPMWPSVPMRGSARRCRRRLDGRIVLGAGVGDTLAVLQWGAVEHVTGHVHLLRVEAERLDDGAVDGAVVGLRVGQRQTDVLVKRETAHLRHVDVLGLHHSGEVTVGGQRARTGRQTQHRVRLALIRSATQRAYSSPASS